MPKSSCFAVFLLTALCFVSNPARAVETSGAAATDSSAEWAALTTLIEQTIEAIYVTGDEAIIEKSVPPDYTIFLAAKAARSPATPVRSCWPTSVGARRPGATRSSRGCATRSR